MPTHDVPRWLVPSVAAAIVMASGLPRPARSEGPAPSDEAAAIVRAIEAPRIPDRELGVADFGGVGDGLANDRPAILAAIEQAHADGGGRVVLPPGIWLSEGPIRLESGVELHVANGATLLFGPAAKDYLPVVRTRWEGTELLGYSPLIYAYGVEDVAITGGGTIDGNAESDFRAWPERQQADQLALRKMGAAGTPVERRVFGEGTYLRPSMIQVVHATRVRLEGYTAVNSPFWVNHLLYTDHAVVRGITVDSHRPNNDGVDVDSSRFVLVERNTFRTGDDCVVIKSGRDQDGRTIARPSEGVVVRDNDMGGEDGIALGSEMSGGIRNVFFLDNVLRKGISAIRFKANLDRGGVVEHVRVRNMKVGSYERLLWFQLDYPGQLGGGHPATYRDIVFEGLAVERAGTVLEVHAPGEAPLRDVLLKDIRVGQAGQSLVLENVEGLVLDNVAIGDQRIDGTLDWRDPSTGSPAPVPGP